MRKKTSRPPSTRTGGRTRFKDYDFLTALGQHCQRLRTQRGYSIDRMSREGVRLSASVIHRLESGSGSVTVSAAARYAATLGVHISELFLFDLPASKTASTPLPLVSSDHPRVQKERFKTLLPVMSLKAVAGNLGIGKAVEPLGWMEVTPKKNLNSDMFIAQVSGDSMSPSLRDGEYAVFQANPSGNLQNRIVLAEYTGPADPDTGGSYTVKRFRATRVLDPNKTLSDSESWENREILLIPSHPDYEPIQIKPSQAEHFKIIAVYCFSIRRS